MIALGWLALSWTGAAKAASWCAAPIRVHESGVAVIRTAEAIPTGVGLPGWLHRTPGVPISTAAVRHLPPNDGIRALPVIQIYAPDRGEDHIPVGLEIGFTQGSASAWYPQIDQLRPAPEANKHTAANGRAALLAQRAARDPHRPQTLVPLRSPPRRPDVRSRLHRADLILSAWAAA